MNAPTGLDRNAVVVQLLVTWEDFYKLVSTTGTSAIRWIDSAGLDRLFGKAVCERARAHKRRGANVQLVPMRADDLAKLQTRALLSTGSTEQPL